MGAGSLILYFGDNMNYETFVSAVIVLIIFFITIMILIGVIFHSKVKIIVSLFKEVKSYLDRLNLYVLDREYLSLFNEFTELKDNPEKYSYRQIFKKFADIEIKLNEIKEVLYYLSSIKDCYDNAKSIVESNSSKDPVVLGYLRIIKAKYDEACTTVIYNGYNNQLNKLKLIMECAVRQLNLVRIGVYL